MFSQIRTTSDWMLALAKAMSRSDIDAIETLIDISEGWLQSSEERNAQISLANSALELIEEIDSMIEY